MAKIVITIEDLPENKVRVVSSPSGEEMVKRTISGEGLTSAHGYAILALNTIREESKKRDPKMIVKLPRFKPGLISVLFMLSLAAGIFI